MPFKYIDPKDAPPIEKKAPKKANELVDLIENLPDDKVAEVTPATGKTIRGVKAGLGRVASARGIKIQTWDNGKKVYVKKVVAV